MSGTNPFRRRDLGTEANSIPSRESRSLQDKISTHVPPIETNVVRPTKAKTSKTVRIISPQPLSSDTDESEQDDIQTKSSTASPPPSLPTPSDRGDSHQDPPTTQLQHDDVDLQGDETRGNAAARLARPAQLTTPVPSNPFKQASSPQRTVDEAIQERTLQREDGPRPQYDVNAFTRLLLTGTKSKNEASETAPQIAFGGVPRERSGPQNEGNVSGPDLRDMNEALQSHATVDDSVDVHIRDGYNGRGNEEGAQRQKPSTPAHRHGKAVNQSAPLTVSFADPSLSSSNDTYATSVSTDSSESKATGTHRETSDSMASTLFTNDGDKEQVGMPSSHLARVPTDIHTPQRKAAPAPPPSRRQGLTRTKSSGTDSNISAPIKENQDSVDPPSTPSSVPNHHKPKPPPPRRGTSVRQDSSSSAVTMSSIPASPESLPQSPPATASSRRPISGISQSSQGAAAPPVPPPRRRGSSQSSHTPSRMSGDYRSLMTQQRSRGDSGASSISQLQMAPLENVGGSQQQPQPSHHAETNDPMADLSALQRELDEYRKSVGRR